MLPLVDATGQLKWAVEILQNHRPAFLQTLFDSFLTWSNTPVSPAHAQLGPEYSSIYLKFPDEATRSTLHTVFEQFPSLFQGEYLEDGTALRLHLSNVVPMELWCEFLSASFSVVIQ